MNTNLKINNQGLLFKTNTQIDRFMIESVEQLKGYSPQQLRVSQQDIYDDFIKTKTGEDIKLSPSKDPFIDVTGFSLRTFTVERFKKHPHSPTAMSATTDFAPIRYLSTMRRMSQINYEGYSKEFKIKNKEVVRSTFRFPGDWLVLKNSPWKFNYAANDHKFSGKGKTDIELIYGLIFLDEEPVQLLMKTPEFEALYKLMTIIINEFSHDFTGHGSIDFIINTPEAGTYFAEASDKADVCTSTLLELRTQRILGSRMASIFDEIRQLNLHMRLIEACIKRNNNYLMEIAENVHTFFDLLKTATGKIPGDLGKQVYNYFGQVYVFCLARMLSSNFLPHVISIANLEMSAGFFKDNNFEKILNILSSHGSGLIVPKKGFGPESSGCGIDDIAYFLDHRTIFMNVHSVLMK